MSITIESLAADKDIADRLAELCDVELQLGSAEKLICTVQGVADLAAFARDGAGGQYALSPRSGRVFYFTSEGQSGLVAENLDAFVTLIVYMPYWHDLLHFSGGGKIEELRRAAPVLEEDWSLDEDNEETRTDLIEHLGLREPADIVRDLHKAVSTRLDIRDPWGNEAAPLFNTFTIDDNPMLKFRD
jgi:hypothetical protein